MILRLKVSLPMAILFAAICAPAMAQESATEERSDGSHSHVGKTARPSDHAPIGVMGDHLHPKGELMISYRFMHMNMAGSRDGTMSIAPQTIATEVPNRFAGLPMQPPTLRVVPVDMTMNMHMLGMMYGLSDNVTVMAMGSVVSKQMAHVTFAGPRGVDELGRFSTSASGIGDLKVAAMIGLDTQGASRTHATFGVSLPVGSLVEEDRILTPMGSEPTVRLPYAMQLGSGTFDLKPAMTFVDRKDDVSWGMQASATIRLGENGNGYTLGDRGELTAWVAYDLFGNSSVSTRVVGWAQGQIDGIDSQIRGPVQTADPANYGGQGLNILFGANYAPDRGFLKNNRLALEVGFPLARDINGPQLETDWTLTLGFQRTF